MKCVEEPKVSQPFTGLETTYGTYSLTCGIVPATVVALCCSCAGAGSGHGWAFGGRHRGGGLLRSPPIVGIADTSSPLYGQLDIVGRAEPASVLYLVAAGAIVGLVSSAAGVAATPYRGAVEEEPPKACRQSVD